MVTAKSSRSEIEPFLYCKTFYIELVSSRRNNTSVRERWYVRTTPIGVTVLVRI